MVVFTNRISLLYDKQGVCVYSPTCNRNRIENLV